MLKRRECSPYARQKSALELEFSDFLANLSPPWDIQSATPDLTVDFLIWKDNFGKTRVHHDGCPFIGHKGNPECACPKRLAYGTVDSLIGKLCAIFASCGRSSVESPIPGYGNPAASRTVKGYLAMVREEQLRARISPSQAEPFFIADLGALVGYITKRLGERGLLPREIFVFARDQAFFKTLFFAGDRAGDLGLVKTCDILYLPDKAGLLFNHVLTKSLRDGTSNLFSLKRYMDPSLCPVAAIEAYVKLCDLLEIPIRQGYLFRPLDPTGKVGTTSFDSAATQSRLSHYVSYLPDVFGSRRITLHGFRSGCAISLAMAGVDLQTLMDHVGWKTSGMARHYLKLNQVIGSGGAGDILAATPLDLTEHYRKQNELLGFALAF